MVSTEIAPNRRSSCGRGVLQLRGWRPLPRPGVREKITHASTKNEDAGDCSSTVSNSQINHADAGVISTKSNLKKALMKYSYNANPGRPGGFDELTIKQGEHVYFHEVNSSNPHWVKAENEQGKIGHVPASYIMEIKAQPSQLPWLENQRLLKEAERSKKEENGTGRFGALDAGMLLPKKYVSAYNPQENATSHEYGCELCGKTFNGPKPYRLHMASRAHKEEVEAQNQNL